MMHIWSVHWKKQVHALVLNVNVCWARIYHIFILLQATLQILPMIYLSAYYL